jgi:IS605 OrfB family transposase
MKLTSLVKVNFDNSHIEELEKLFTIYGNVFNFVSEIAYKNNVFSPIKLVNISYHEARAEFPELSSAMVVLIIREVSGNYKAQITQIKKHNSKKKVKRKRKLSLMKRKVNNCVCYNEKVLGFKENNEISIWIFGRKVVSYTCSERENLLLKSQKGQCDLIRRDNNFYLFFVYDVEEMSEINVKDFIGVDLGVTNIAVTDDGTIYSGAAINNYRWKKRKIRASLQRKAHKGSKSTRKNCRRILKRLSGLERRYAANVNHCLSKEIVTKAVEQGKGLAFEDLTGIRMMERRSGKTHRLRLSSWSFYQLKTFCEYKAKLKGIPFISVASAYTSKTCSCCGSKGVRAGSLFTCTTCGYVDHADVNAAKNIAGRGRFAYSSENSLSSSCSTAGG